MTTILTQLEVYFNEGKYDQFIDLIKQVPTINLNTPFKSGFTPLQAAAYRMNFRCVKALIQYGLNIDINFVCDDSTALSVATVQYKFCRTQDLNECFEIIKFLILSGANVLDCSFHHSDNYQQNGSLFEDICTRIFMFDVDINNGTEGEQVKELIQLFIDRGADRDVIYNKLAYQDASESVDNVGHTIDSYLRYRKKDDWANYIHNYQPVPVKGCHNG